MKPKVDKRNELDKYLEELQKIEGIGAINAFAERLGINRTSLWRFRVGKQKPNKQMRNKIKRLTIGIVLPEHF